MLIKLYRICVVALLSASAFSGTPATAQTAVSPLGNLGPYPVGLRFMNLTDVRRENRPIELAIWYPAVQPAAPEAQQRMLGDPSDWGWLRAAPALQDGPYPLIIHSPGLLRGNLDYRALNILLASQGYVVVALTHAQDNLQTSFVDRPLDVLFTLDQLAALTDDPLADMIDSEQVGVIGESQGAYTALLMAGARIDPALASALTGADDPTALFPDWNWDALDVYRSTYLPSETNDDTLWATFIDSRIHAVVMISPCYGGSMFGTDGLATVIVPALIVAGVLDTSSDCTYQRHAVYTFDHIAAQDKYLLSLVKEGHVPGMVGVTAPVTAQLFAAFFGVYLKGDQDDREYLTPEYIEGIANSSELGLVWGAYDG